MKILSFNCRGLAYPHKKYYLQRMVVSNQPNLLLLQETMGDEATVVSWLKVGFKNWDFVGLDANGHSRGVVLGWNTMRIKISTTWVFDSGLGALVQEVGLEKELKY
jgi:exonuclease III